MAGARRPDPPGAARDRPEFTYTYDLLINDAALCDGRTRLLAGSHAHGSTRSPTRCSATSGRSAGIAAARNRILKQLETPAAEADYPNGFDAYYGVSLRRHSVPEPVRHLPGRREVGGARVADRAPLLVVDIAGCANWPTAPDRYVGPWTARTSAPVLVVGNLYDPITYYAVGASQRPVAAQQPPAGLRRLGPHRLRAQRLHHGRTSTEYLLTGALPPEGTVCPAPPNPFNTVADQRPAPRVLAGVPPTMPGSR